MSWTGATLFRSNDAGASYAAVTSSTTAATIGTATTVLGNFSGGNIFDELNSVTVVLRAGGPLLSYTEAQVLNGAGLCVIGAAGRREVLQYKVATLISPKTYRLTGLLRGRRGTEWAMGLHASGDAFVLADPAAWRRPNPGTSDIGLSRLYKPVTARASAASVTAQPFTNSAAGLRPYSVVYIGGGRSGSGDLLINWIRRGRLSGEWRNLVEVPLSEQNEAYEVDIWSADRSTLLRTLSVIGPAVTYSAADQATDGTTATQVSVSVYQLSAVVGRGFGARALLPGGSTVAERDAVTAPVSAPPPELPTDPVPTLYVATTGSNSNPGTLAAPFLTIGHASSVAVPGDIISVADGTYYGSFQTTKDGAIGAPITFVAENRWGAKIVPPASSARDYAWDSRGDYIIIDGFEVDGTIDPTSGTVWRVGVGVAGEGSQVKNCHVHHICGSLTPSSAGGAGILLDSYYTGQNMQALGNRVHHVGPSSAPTSIYYQGIYQTASGKIENNVSFANTGGAIHCWHDARHIDITNNTVFANGTWGIVFGGGDYVNLAAPCDYITVTNNIVYGNTTGIRELGDIGSNNLISTNLCFANGTAYSLNVSSHSGDINADPLFVNYQADGSGDYHLQAGSPAVNAGLATYAPNTDFDGVTRTPGACDIGAFERP